MTESTKHSRNSQTQPKQGSDDYSKKQPIDHSLLCETAHLFESPPESSVLIAKKKNRSWKCRSRMRLRLINPSNRKCRCPSVILCEGLGKAYRLAPNAGCPLLSMVGDEASALGVSYRFERRAKGPPTSRKMALEGEVLFIGSSSRWYGMSRSANLCLRLNDYFG